MIKRILVTGGAGFIGHHLVEFIHADRVEAVELILLDRLDCSGNLNRLAEIGARVRFVFHDLKAPISEQVAKQIGKVDCIVHMAASTHVDRSIEDPLSFVMDNVVGTCNLLDYARRYGCERFLYFSTDEVFGPAPPGVRYKEWDRYKSGNPYAASKAGGEELALSYHNTYGVPVVITHTMNVIGRRQSPEKFVPSTIRKVLKGETVTIHADATRTKPGSRFYIHADDVADAVLNLIYHGTAGEKYNIVGAEEVDNLTMARMIADIIGDAAPALKYELVDFHSSRPGHDLRYALDGSKMREEFGWEPAMDTYHALADIVTWTLRNRQWL